MAKEKVEREETAQRKALDEERRQIEAERKVLEVQRLEHQRKLEELEKIEKERRQEEKQREKEAERKTLELKRLEHQRKLQELETIKRERRQEEERRQIEAERKVLEIQRLEHQRKLEELEKIEKERCQEEKQREKEAERKTLELKRLEHQRKLQELETIERERRQEEERRQIEAEKKVLELQRLEHQRKLEELEKIERERCQEEKQREKEAERKALELQRLEHQRKLQELETIKMSNSNLDNTSVDVEQALDAGKSAGSDRINWTAAEAFRLVQGGLLCKGIYLAKDFEKLEKEREPVVDVSDSLEFNGTQLAQELIHREFHSDLLRHLFEQTLDKNKKSESMSAGLVIWGMGLGRGGGLTKKRGSEILAEETKLKGQSYVASVHYQMVPIKSIHLTYKNIQLKSDAITELQNIEQNIKLVRYKANGQFRGFFERYGSHVHYGLIELGATLIATASCKGFEESCRKKMTEMTTMASQKFASLGFRHPMSSAQHHASIKASDLKSKESINYHESDLKQITISLKKIGGPDDSNDKQEWTRELERNSNLWRVIGRNSNPKPIWELLEKYKDKFESPLLLAHAMEEEWKKETQMNGSISKRGIDDLRKDIGLWIELNSKEQNIVETFQGLSSIRHKHKIMDEDWRDEVLYSLEVQNILVNTTKILPDKSDVLQIQQAVAYLRNILRPPNKIGNQRFPEVKNIISRITEAERAIHPEYFEVDNISTLGNVLRDKVKLIDSDKEDLYLKLGNIQQNLERILKDWSHKPDKRYEY